MRTLLDTHALLWWMHDSGKLSVAARDLIRDPKSELLWSAASTWEIAVKLATGKLRLEEPLRSFFPRIARDLSLTLVVIEHSHCLQVGELPPLHRDPFDRMLVAQAQVEHVPIVSADPRIGQYSVEVVW